MITRLLTVLAVAGGIAFAWIAAADATNDRSVRVQFAPGTSGATMKGKLGSEQAIRYVLGARKNQFLRVTLHPNNPLTYYIIYVPGGDILYESSQGGNEYYGQLYRSGDHIVEVFYKGEPGTSGRFSIDFAITAKSSGAAVAPAKPSSGGAPSTDEQACLQAVSAETSNGDVTVLEVETSEANNLVMVGVGPDRAPWRCLVKDGVVAEVMSMVDEGAL